MKVGVFAGDVVPQSGGGYTFVQEVVEQLESLQSAASHDFVLLTTAGDVGGAYGKLPVLALPPTQTNWPLRVRRAIGRRVDRLFVKPATGVGLPDPRLAEIIKANQFDVLWYLQQGTFCSLDVPYITIVWDLQHRLQPFFPEVSNGVEFAFRDEVFSTLLRRAALVLTGTETGSQEIQRFFGVAPERIRILPHPTPSFALQDASGVGRPARAPAGPYIYYPAQYWPHKNHVNLLESLRLVRERHGIPMSLVLSGSDKGNQAFIRDYTKRLGLTDAVHDLGFVSRTDLVGLYRHAFALCYVTFFGPENLPPLEAFSLGCPVVASDVAGAREQLGDAALLVDPTSPDQIATALARLYAEPALAQTLVSRGHARARQFTGRHFVEGVIAWLDQFAAIRRNWRAADFQ